MTAPADKGSFSAPSGGSQPAECPQTERIADGDRLRIDLQKGEIENLTKKESYPCEKLPEHVLAIIEAGGMFEYLKSRRDT